MTLDSEWDPTLHALLDHMLKVEASDLYITAGSPPVFRIDGVGYPAKHALDADTIAAMAATPAPTSGRPPRRPPPSPSR
jgi:Tfp pilus assembly ATPase PilU